MSGRRNKFVNDPKWIFKPQTRNTNSVVNKSKYIKEEDRRYN